MKHQITITALLIAALLLASCATNRAVETSNTVFAHAHEGILPSYRDYFGKEPEYEVQGPRDTDALDKKHGWSEYCFVTREADETVWRIKYVKNRSWAIESVEIKKPTDDLFLGKYIGKPKADVLQDFPSGANDRGFVILYESDEFLISFSVADGAVTYINILTKDEKAEAESARPPLDDDGEVHHSPLIAKDITLDGANQIRTQFRDSFTDRPVANARCIVYVVQGDEMSQIHTKTDENGWLYITNIPDGECYAEILD